MFAYNEFNKALRYLDMGKMELGEKYLKNSIKIAESENDSKMLIALYCCYGDYLYCTNNDILAIKYLEKVKELKNKLKEYDDGFNYEFNRAEELLQMIERQK